MTLSSKREPTTVEQLEFQIMTPPVVATTCLSIDKYVDGFTDETELMGSIQCLVLSAKV